MDQRVARFATYADLLRLLRALGRRRWAAWCSTSLGYRDEQRHALADATCIGLQLANFWQDVSVDLRQGPHLHPGGGHARRFG